MNIQRVLAALQKSTHYTDLQMAHEFPELQALREASYLESIRWDVARRRHKILGYCQLADRVFVPRFDANKYRGSLMGVAIADFDYVGFSGSRHGAPSAVVEGALYKVYEGATICVGCAAGVDEQVRRWIGDTDYLKVFRAVDHPGSNYAQKLANRSAAMVEFLKGKNSCLIAFPMATCPIGVEPCQQWRSAKGSGTWGTIALSVGLGIPTMIWLPADIAAPGWGDRLEQVNRNWWLSLPF